jgi:hypothetical protein
LSGLSPTSTSRASSASLSHRRPMTHDLIDNGKSEPALTEKSDTILAIQAKAHFHCKEQNLEKRQLVGFEIAICWLSLMT